MKHVNKNSSREFFLNICCGSKPISVVNGYTWGAVHGFIPSLFKMGNSSEQQWIYFYMFVNVYAKMWSGTSSRTYCLFGKSTNSNCLITLLSKASSHRYSWLSSSKTLVFISCTRIQLNPRDGEGYCYYCNWPKRCHHVHFIRMHCGHQAMRRLKKDAKKNTQGFKTTSFLFPAAVHAMYCDTYSTHKILPNLTKYSHWWKTNTKCNKNILDIR